METLIVTVLVVLVVVVLLARSVRIVPQAHAGIVERLGRYQRTLGPGLTLLIPMVDRVKPLIDTYETLPFGISSWHHDLRHPESSITH